MSDRRDPAGDAVPDWDERPTAQLEVPTSWLRAQTPPTEAQTPPTEAQTPHDALAAYALGALDVDEQRLFELHLFVCATCRGELPSYQRTVSLLPHALPPAQPPDGSRSRLLARARAVASESMTVSTPIGRSDEAPTAVHTVPTFLRAAPKPREAETVVEPAPAQESSTGWTRPRPAPTTQAPTRRGIRIKLASIGWGVALLLLIASGLFVVAWSATGPHASPEIQILARLPGGQVLSLRGTTVPSASARLFVAENGRRAELAVDSLPPLPPGRVYQLWFDEPGQPSRTGGAFGVDQRGNAAVRVVIPTPLERVRGIGITQEPAPGLASPTGVRLLDGTP